MRTERLWTNTKLAVNITGMARMYLTASKFTESN